MKTSTKDVKNKTSSQKVKVYYDGLCVVCSKEMDVYKKKDVEKKIHFIDISSSVFDASLEGLDSQKVKKVLHVKDSHNKLHTGVDGFIAIWDVLGILRPLSKMAQSRFLRPFFDLGYFSFAKIRPLLPKKKCDQGNCHLHGKH